MPSPDVVLDLTVVEGLLALGDGDRAFVLDLFDTHEEESAAVVQRMGQAIAEENSPAMSRAAHALAGASLNLGAASLAAVCRGIEAAMGRTGATPSAADLDAIRTEVARLHAAMANFRSPDR